MAVRTPRLCLVVPLAYPVLNPDCAGPIGGSEVRAILLARELAKRGRFEVHVVTFDHGQPRREVRDGVIVDSRAGEIPPVLPMPVPAWFTRIGASRLASSANPAARIAGTLVNVLHGVMSPLRAYRRRSRDRNRSAGFVGEYPISRERLALYDEIDANVYAVAPGGLFESAEVAFHCKQRGRPFVFLAASDRDYDALHKTHPEKRGHSGLPGYLHLFAIESAAAHVVQTEEQAQALRAGFGRASFVVRNPVDTTPAFPRRADTRTVLWVGKSSPEKRPDLLVEIVRKLPELPFVVIMNRASESLDDRTRADLAALPNVTLLERVPPPQIESYYADAALLLNTSDVEGFPNAFLQAAKYGVPIVSLRVDPGGMLSVHGCGRTCAGDLEKTVTEIRAFEGSPERRREASVKCLDYVRKFHEKTAIVAEIEQILLDLVA